MTDKEVVILTDGDSTDEVRASGKIWDLTELLGQENSEPLTPAVENSQEPDPLAHLIGDTDPTADQDPFAMMLDGMLAQEGLSKETETPEHKTASYEDHEWEFKSELVYEEDLVEAICKKCFRQMRMTRQQSWNEAMEAHGIGRDCGQVIADEVMSS